MLPPETREGHCRLGWSLSTGSLQAPVGYDKSSYAYRDIAGSKVILGGQSAPFPGCFVIVVEQTKAKALYFVIIVKQTKVKALYFLVCLPL